MQLIKIGEVTQKTVLDMVQEMADRQLAEIEQLKMAAKSRMQERRPRTRRQRCDSAKPVSH